MISFIVKTLRWAQKSTTIYSNVKKCVSKKKFCAMIWELIRVRADKLFFVFVSFPFLRVGKFEEKKEDYVNLLVRHRLQILEKRKLALI